MYPWRKKNKYKYKYKYKYKNDGNSLVETDTVSFRISRRERYHETIEADPLFNLFSNNLIFLKCNIPWFRVRKLLS